MRIVSTNIGLDSTREAGFSRFEGNTKLNRSKSQEKKQGDGIGMVYSVQAESGTATIFRSRE
jgi:hypothetical protein